jgi:Fe-S-cluster containining protein
VFLDKKYTCGIYETRPSECRAFKCWDTKEIEMKYDEDPLERADLLADVEGLWDVICDHQDRCSYQAMKELTDKIGDDQKEEVLAAINEIIKYDNSLRETLVEKANVNPDMLHFLLPHWSVYIFLGAPHYRAGFIPFLHSSNRNSNRLLIFHT